MDIRIVITRRVVYLAAFVAAGLILITVLVASSLKLADPHRAPLREVVLALAVAVVVSPRKAQIQRGFDSDLYREPYDGTPRPILGNASQLEQLFLNLCLNALEAMGPGGELTVRVADLSEAAGTTLLVEISDTGCGIPEELLATIFNPFVTTKAHGTGLGLAICRSITDAHHARFGARNNVGRSGSTFTIEFPVPVGTAARIKA